MGYANRLLIREFPDLSEDDDAIYVTIVNPKTLPLARLTPRQVQLDADGKPANPDEATAATYELLASLVHDWHVYDANDMAEHPVPMPLPATGDLVACLPIEILTDLTEQITKVAAVPQ